VCMRCQKGGFPCLGYTLVPRFVDEIPKMKRRESMEKSQVEDMKAKSHYFQTSQIKTSIINVQLSSIAFQDTIILSFLAAKLAKGRVSTNPSWILHLPHPSRKAVMALASSFFGFAYQQSDIGVRALELYGHVLSDIRGWITREAGVKGNVMAATITVMGLFEVRK
jgi:hypothetical protein